MKRLIGLCTCLSVLFIAHVQADDIAFPHISTTGYGQVSVTPDSASFSVQVEQTTMNADQAKSEVDSVVSKFMDRLQALGVSPQNIKSSNLLLTPQYYYPKEGHAELVGYRATRRVDVNVDKLDALNQYLDAAIEDGVNRVNNIQLKVKDRARYIKQARLAAIQDANEKAQSLAAGFNRTLGPVWNVSYRTNSTEAQPARMMALSKNSSNNGYQDSSIVIQDSVDVIYRLSE